VLGLLGGCSPTETPDTLAETQQKADQGNADAQYNLGVMYAIGRGVAQDFNDWGWVPQR
jgi:hypothetical protein